MQLMIDTSLDSPELLRMAAELLKFASFEVKADERVTDEVPAGTPDVKVQVPNTIIEQCKIVSIADGTPLSAATVGFGKSPLPAGAIAPDLPASFIVPSPPAETQAASVTGVPAAPERTTAPTSALPAMTTTAHLPPPAPAATGPAASGVPLPTVPAAPASPASAPSDEDTDGYVWDARIHSSSKKKHPDGRWHKRRGVAPDVAAKVKAEQRAAEVPAYLANNAETHAAAILLATAANAGTPAYIDSYVTPEHLANVEQLLSVPPPPPPPLAINPAEVERLERAAHMNVPPPPPFVPAVVEGQTAQPASIIAAVPPAPAAAGPTSVGVPVATPPPAPAPPPVQPVAPAPSATMTSCFDAVVTNYQELMDYVVNPSFKDKKITPFEVRDIVKSLGLAGLQDLIPTHARINDVADAVRAKVRA